jgi:acetyl-CoA acetyltransferase
MTRDIAIVGIGETPALRRSPKDIREMTLDAIFMALDDAGIDPREVDGFVTESTLMPTKVPHEYVGPQLGIARSFDASLSSVGAGIVGAPLLAADAIQSGRAKVVVSYFGIDWGSDVKGPYQFHDPYPAKKAFEKPYGFDGQPSYFALWARRYMHEYGLRPEQLGALAVQQRENAIRTGRAQMMKPLTLDDYMRSPIISTPLRYSDCCVISDGAAAYVMTSAERARDCAKPPVYVRGVGFASEGSPENLFSQGQHLMELPGARTARERAERAAGVSLSEADFGELYDCFTVECLMQMEDLGLCEKGEAGEMVAAGHTRLGGRLPLNTHGGLLSYSYRLCIEHVIEAVRQLRREAGDVQVEDAELGFVTGVTSPDFSVLILSR